MRVSVALIAAILTACQSDAEKLERLEFDRSMALLNVLRWEQAVSAKTPAADDSLAAARRQYLLADRAYRMFLDGKD